MHGPGQGLADDEILRLEPMLTDSLQDLICNLQRSTCCAAMRRGEWLLCHATWTRSAWPICTNAPSCASQWPSSICRTVTTAWAVPRWRRWTICGCLRERLKRRVSDIYTDSGDMP